MRLDGLGSELDSDGGVRAHLELVVYEPHEYAGLPHASIIPEVLWSPMMMYFSK